MIPMQKNKKKDKSTRMLEEPVNKLIPAMAVPTIVAQLITTIYNLADTYFVSSLGVNATAAVGVNGSLERTITLIGSLLGAGACSYIARLLGAGRKKEAETVLSTSFFTGCGLGILLLIAGLIFVSPLVQLLGATEDCAVYAMQYAQYVLLAAPFMVGSFILNMCLRSEGSATFAMVGIGIGGLLNCVLDPIFIFALGLGVKGASIATAISKFISFCILLTPYLRKKCTVSIRLKAFKFVAQDVKEVLGIGSTSFFRSLFGVVANVVTNQIAGGFSTAALAALSVANRVMEFPFSIILGYGQGYQPVVGFNWGAKRFDRVKKSLQFGVTSSLIGAVIMGAIIFLGARPIISAFNSEADAEVLRLGLLCIRLQCIALPIHAFTSLINMFYAGVGIAKYALLMSTARQGYCLIPVVLIVPALIGVDGMAASQAIADVVSLLVAVPLTVHAVRLLKAKQAALDESETAV